MLLFFRAESHAVPGQYVADVINGTADILRYASTVAATNMPLMIDAPDWYKAFLESWTHVKAHAMTWINTLDPLMTSAIDSILAFNEMVTDDLATALDDIDKLIANPNNQGARDNLGKTLADILKLTGNTPDKLASFEKQLDQFRSDIEADQRVLAGTVTAAINQTQADKDQIAALNRDIGALRDQINRYNTLIQVEDVSWKAGIGIAVVGVFVGIGSAGVGYVLVGVGVTMIAGGLIGKILTDKAIADCQVRILQDQASIGSLNTQIAVLASLTDLLNKLVDLNKSAQSAAAKIRAFWTDFETDIAAFLASVQDTQKDTDYTKAKQDIQAAQLKWQALQALLAPLGSLAFDTGGEPVILPKAA